MTPSTLPTLFLALSVPATQIVAYGRESLVAMGGQEALVSRDMLRPTAIREHAVATHTLMSREAWLAIFGIQDRFQEALQQIWEYEGLPEGWDGDMGQSASEEASDAAREFLRALPDGVPEPSTMISPDGEIGLYWAEGDYYAEVGFQSGNRSYFFSKGAGRTPVYLDDYEPSEQLIHCELADALQEPVLLAA